MNQTPQNKIEKCVICRLTATFGTMPGGGPRIVVNVIDTPVWIDCFLPTYQQKVKSNWEFKRVKYLYSEQQTSWQTFNLVHFISKSIYFSSL